MKKIIFILSALIAVLALSSCGGNGGNGGNESKPAEKGTFQVGFAKIDVTPTKPVHLTSYGDDETRISEGAMHDIFVHAVVMRDEDGKTIAIVTTDQSWGNANMLNDIRPLVEEKWGLASDSFMLGGIHNHNAPHYAYHDENGQEWTETFQNAIVDVIGLAIEDLAPAKIEVGRTATEHLTFVRRYLLANGDWSGDNSNYNHNSTIVSHETDADEEVQLVRFVREGDHKDIVMVNWQAHAAKHGHTNFISADFAGPLRDKVESTMGVHCIFYQGACGNLNPVSRIAGECPTGGTGYERAVEHGELVADVAIKALNTVGVMKEIKSGKIQTKQEIFSTDAAFDESNTIAVGDLSFVTFPAEFFDVLGKKIKDDTPFEMTVLLGFHCGKGQYLASYEGYLHGGYEPTNTRYAAGDGEKFVDFYLQKLKELRDAQ